MRPGKSSFLCHRAYPLFSARTLSVFAFILSPKCKRSFFRPRCPANPLHSARALRSGTLTLLAFAIRRKITRPVTFLAPFLSSSCLFPTAAPPCRLFIALLLLTMLAGPSALLACILEDALRILEYHWCSLWWCFELRLICLVGRFLYKSL